MIIFKRLPENGYVAEELFILETVEEFKAYQKKTKVKLASFEQCEKGDYILTDNGYYVPVTYVKERTFGTKDLKGRQRYVETTNMSFSFKVYPTGNRVRKYLDYDPHKRQIHRGDDRRRMMPTSTVYAIIKLMGAGLNLVDAFKVSCQKYIQGKGKANKYHRAIYAFLNNKNNIKMLIEYGLGGQIMAKKNLGIDADSMVKRWENIINGTEKDGKPFPTAMRVKAMELLQRYYGEKEVMEPKKEIYEGEMNEYNEILEKMAKKVD